MWLLHVPLHIPPCCCVRCAVSALYYMLTAYSGELAGSEEGRRAVLLAADALLVALKVMSLHLCGPDVCSLCKGVLQLRPLVPSGRGSHHSR